MLFCPEHLAIVKAGPAERRAFLDVAICQLKPMYLKSLQRFQKILTQRNALLKQLADGEGDFALLGILSEQLARECAFIYRTRADYIERLDAFVKRFFAELSADGGEGADEIPSLRYVNSLKLSERLEEAEAQERYLERLTTGTAREIAAGATLWGVHKDDIRITLNGRPARLYASQGQQRSLALAMKLAEGWVSALESGGDMPVFLFDDVLSELDVHRRDYLVSEMRGRQVIMTACDPSAADFGERIHLIRVHGGRYS